MEYRNIDWNRMWREARRHKSWKSKNHNEWDRKAAAFARRNYGSPYVEQFLRLMAPVPEWSVLDVGSGPGTLAVPLAGLVGKVTALDFSGEMLQILRRHAAKEGLENLTTVRASWVDDWGHLGIEAHDAVIASRSLAVEDLRQALLRLNQWALRKVFITDRVGPGPFDPGAFVALGREFNPGPDYIYTLNLLYGLGIHARVDFIQGGHFCQYASREQAIASFSWMFDDLTSAEERKLAAYVDSRLVRLHEAAWLIKRPSGAEWAFISWEKR